MSAPNVMQRDAGARQSPGGLVLPLPSPLLAMLPPMLQDKPMQWFVQDVPVLALAPGVSKAGQFSTDQTHAYAAFYCSLDVRSADLQTDRNADPASLTMTDTQNLVYQTAATTIPTVNVFGSGKQPAIWPVPLIVKQNNGIILTVTNESLANTNTYRFSFMGVLIKVPSSLQIF
jgi:hypothetical protein